ncbi:unnamed protein product [Durusdinium trenchii]|uniref:WD_REPEATS_REGION domain-containing protein n=2 Tax=Durusdinium trenchii TaxID=1381693 RepID=A0ABP0IJM9_9DINO
MRQVAVFWAALLPLVAAEVEAVPADECEEDAGTCALSALQLKTGKEPTPGSFSVTLATEDAEGRVSAPKAALQEGAEQERRAGDQSRHQRGAACCRCASGEVGFSATGSCGFCSGRLDRTVAAPTGCNEPSLLQSARTACAQQCGKQLRRKSWYPADFQ